MKKIFFLFCLSFLLVSCVSHQNITNTGGSIDIHTQTGTEQVAGADSEAKKVVIDFAEHMNKTAKDVHEVKEEFTGFFSTQMLPSYQIKSDVISYEVMEKMAAYKFLDGWVEADHADGIHGYSVMYYRDNIICKEDVVLQNTELLDFIGENADMDPAEVEEYLKGRKYIRTFTCAERSKDIVSIMDLNFEAFGGTEDTPTWNLVFNQHMVYLGFSELENDKVFVIQSSKKTENGYEIEASGGGEEMSLKIEKKPCYLYADPETVDPSEVSGYSVELTWYGKKYPGCGNDTDEFLTWGRFGKISSFVKKTGIKYTGKLPKDADYHIYQKKNLVLVQFSHPDKPEDFEFIVLRKVEGDAEIYWNGGSTVDPEVCERFSLDEELMSFWPFYYCSKQERW